MGPGPGRLARSASAGSLCGPGTFTPARRTPRSSAEASYDLRRVRAYCPALAELIVGLFARTIRRDLVGPVEQFGVDAIPLDQPIDASITSRCSHLSDCSSRMLRISLFFLSRRGVESIVVRYRRRAVSDRCVRRGIISRYKKWSNRKPEIMDSFVRNPL